MARSQEKADTLEYSVRKEFLERLAVTRELQRQKLLDRKAERKQLEAKAGQRDSKEAIDYANDVEAHKALLAKVLIFVCYFVFVVNEYLITFFLSSFYLLIFNFYFFYYFCFSHHSLHTFCLPRPGLGNRYAIPRRAARLVASRLGQLCRRHGTYLGS